MTEHKKGTARESNQPIPPAAPEAPKKDEVDDDDDNGNGGCVAISVILD